MSKATAVAHSNIALVKYWGKADVERNLPAVPSLSVTLGALSTRTTVRFDTALEHDDVILDGQPATDRPKERVTRLLTEIRRRAGERRFARVESENDFPTAAGLASSASGFAALVLAAAAAASVDLTPGEASSLARAASVSAARSIYGGVVVLPAGAEAAEPLAKPDHLDVTMTIALTAAGPKAVSSTAGMLRTAKSSPYYPAWVQHAPELFEEARAAVLARDLRRLGEAMEQSTLMMHACMWAGRPALDYLAPATLAAIGAVRALRDDGVAAYFTMDAGPHVKVLAARDDAERVRRALERVDGVLRVLSSPVGGDARVERNA